MSFGPPPAVPAPAPSGPPAWVAPTDVEQALWEAKARNDWAGYFDVLARTRLYFEIVRERYDATPGSRHVVFGHDPRVVGGRVWNVFTVGMLPAPDPHRVFDWERLGWFARAWQPSDPPFLVVNPGTPCEAFLPTAPPHSAAWAQHSERVGALDIAKRLCTLRVGGPLQGPVARGLACEALLCVNNGSPWNAMAWHGSGYPGERERLREWWGITSREEWQSALRGLLACESHSSVWEFALSLRRTIARDFGGYVDVAYWREAAARVIRANDAGHVVVTDDGVTKTEPRPESETEARVRGVQHLIGRISRYEARMRADGILDENRYVSSVDAWDLGRASKMARWGLGARFGSLQEAESAVVQAGRAALLSYRSWQDFSAGYILGRCLHFDDEEFGEWYTDMVDAHRVLMSEAGSPWLTVPFQ
ncbi:DUF1266 domain-containing protein [Streptomyces griseosporeus]|uniref:DUF1266 domain-containing protein n=1 Tax=Streptomyces griseosporeus TaxID=1910 RepID=UPI00167C6182|nr:DUF1266 domain-containing protein [Streptomyces griseosporeus]GHF64509.1 hypothetical protein GCM10018783_37500 [Streptomyces griseosporeus]